jgi:hypothetical protein
MPAIPRHHRYSLTSQRMPRVGDFHFWWKPAGVVLQCVTDFKGQLDLERHGGHTPAGVTTRVVQRVLALTAAIWHNDHAGQRVMRSLIGYDHY